MPRPPKEPSALRSIVSGAKRSANLERRFIASVSAIQFNSGTYGPDNVGDQLQVETTGTIVTDFTQPYASRYAATNYGSALNIDNGLLLTAPADSWFNSGNPVFTIEHYGTGTNGGYGQLIEVSATNAEAIGLQILADANGGSNATGITVTASMGSSGTVNAIGGDYKGSNQGSGKEIGMQCSTAGHQTGANSLALLCTDASSNHLLEVRNDGTFHIKTGASWTADL